MLSLPDILTQYTYNYTNNTLHYLLSGLHIGSLIANSTKKEKGIQYVITYKKAVCFVNWELST